jgi:hypothetical protein
MQRKPLLVLAPVVAAVALLAALPAGRERILLAIGDFLIIQDAPQPADVIHVLSGPDNRTE